jgi:two-component system KDP operon response regulator KdpE
MNAVMAKERPRTALLSKKKPGVLVVDDQPAIRHILRLSLERQGIPVWGAADGETALELFREQREAIGLVLLDVRLPGMSGPETLRTLRDLDAALPCCFMSGGAGPYTEADLLELGALHFFAKPFALNVVTEVVRNLLKPR